MKLSLPILSLCLSSLAAADLSLFGSSQKVLEDKPEVPGANPLTYCKAEHGDDILTLDYVDLSPNPPSKGAKLTIEASGILSEAVAEGAYVQLQVKYGLIRLVSTTADLCEQVQNVDMECPIKKGETKITKEVELPAEIPPGTYTVFADAYTVDDKKIVCMEATVKF